MLPSCHIVSVSMHERSLVDGCQMKWLDAACRCLVPAAPSVSDQGPRWVELNSVCQTSSSHRCQAFDTHQELCHVGQQESGGLAPRRRFRVHRNPRRTLYFTRHSGIWRPDNFGGHTKLLMPHQQGSAMLTRDRIVPSDQERSPSRRWSSQRHLQHPLPRHPPRWHPWLFRMAGRRWSIHMDLLRTPHRNSNPHGLLDHCVQHVATSERESPLSWQTH